MSAGSSHQRARRYVVRGRVQGVSFRHFTRGAARELGVRGWVRNLPDGTVEVRASAEPAMLDRLEERLRQGPPASRVSSVERTDLDEGPGGEDFRIVFWPDGD